MGTACSVGSGHIIGDWTTTTSTRQGGRHRRPPKHIGRGLRRKLYNFASAPTYNGDHAYVTYGEQKQDAESVD